MRLGHVIRYIGRGRPAVTALRKPDRIYGPRCRYKLAAGQLPTIPDGLPHSRQSEHILQAAGHLVAIEIRVRTRRGMSKYSAGRLNALAIALAR